MKSLLGVACLLILIFSGIKEGSGTKIEISRGNSRTLCWIFVNDVHGAKKIQNTWGQKCGKLLFVGQKEDGTLPIELVIEKSEFNYWTLYQRTYRYIHQKYRGDYNWFIMAESDSYLYYESFKLISTTHEHQNPFFFANFPNVDVDSSYFEASSGTLMSSSALEIFVSQCSSMYAGDLQQQTVRFANRQLNDCLKREDVTILSICDVRSVALSDDLHTIMPTIKTKMKESCNGLVVSYFAVKPDQMTQLHDSVQSMELEWRLTGSKKSQTKPKQTQKPEKAKKEESKKEEQQKEEGKKCDCASEIEKSFETMLQERIRSLVKETVESEMAKQWKMGMKNVCEARVRQ